MPGPCGFFLIDPGAAMIIILGQWATVIFLLVWRAR